MGMMKAGEWCVEDSIHQGDEYVRNVSNCHFKIEPEEIVANPKRFYLIASWSCPWSHRAMIYRQLAGLSHYITLHMTSTKTQQGYSANNGKVWLIPGAALEDEARIIYLHQLYKFHDQCYTGRSTVPILWDSQQLKIVSNESSHIIKLLQAAGELLNSESTAALLGTSFDHSPPLVALNKAIYQDLSNGVYRAGFAKSQRAYDRAVTAVFNMLDTLELRLADRQFLLANQPCQADWLLFPTLVRFDIDYYLHSGCCYKKLSDYPLLWRYARTLYAISGIAETVNFAAIHASNYQSSAILPVLPKQDWAID